MSTSNVVCFPQTGPKTTAGKRRSSINRLQAGIYSNSCVIQGESLQEFHTFARGIVASLNCGGDPLLVAGAERLASALWRERRVRRFENESLNHTAQKAQERRALADVTSREAEEVEAQRLALRELVSTNMWVDAGSVQRVALAAEAVGRAHDRSDKNTALEMAMLGYDAVAIACDSKLTGKRMRAAIIEKLTASLQPLYRDPDPAVVRVYENDEYEARWGLVDSVLQAVVKQLNAAAATLFAEAARYQTESAIPDVHLGQRVQDAEGRTSRLVSRALADFQTMRAVRAAAEAEPLMLPARAVR